ncbi:MAG: Flp pilus assembly protein CpaB [Acidobacteriota bacterium]
MKKDNMGKLLGVALVVAILCTGLFYMMFAMKANSQTGTTMVVAAKALKAGTVLKAEDLKTINWPVPQLPPGAHHNPQEVIGNTVFDTMAAEEPVLNARLATSLSGGGAGVPVGMRAVSIHLTDSTGVLGLLRGGQTVDVQVVIGRGTKPDEVEVRTALENLTVLSVNPQPEQGSQGQNLPVVTLLAKPAEVDILAAADSGGRVRLSLRNPLDSDKRSRGSLSLGTVMRGGARGELAENR